MSKQEAYYASSEGVEWYTPAYIWQGALQVMGAIDCDPCSNPEPFNVPATVHYTRADDGLLQPWHPRCYVNPPYGDALPFWVDKLRAELALGRCVEAITLTPARTDTAWFQGLWQAEALCFVRGRVQYIRGDGSTDSTSTFPSVLSYWGASVDRFAAVFGTIGQVLYPNAPPRVHAHQLTLLEATG